MHQRADTILKKVDLVTRNEVDAKDTVDVPRQSDDGLHRGLFSNI